MGPNHLTTLKRACGFTAEADKMLPEQPGEGRRTGNRPAFALRAVLEAAIVAAGAVIGPLLADIRLRGYFHAAALADLDLRHVAAWVSGSRPEEPEEILYSTAGAATHLADQLAEMRGEANKPISTVRMTMSRALAFLADPSLSAAVLPDSGQSLDIPEFLRETGTLYLIAETRGEDAPSRLCLPAWRTRSTTWPRCWAASCPPEGWTRRC